VQNTETEAKGFIKTEEAERAASLQPILNDRREELSIAGYAVESRKVIAARSPDVPPIPPVRTGRIAPYNWEGKAYQRKRIQVERITGFLTDNVANKANDAPVQQSNIGSLTCGPRVRVLQIAFAGLFQHWCTEIVINIYSDI